MQQVGVGIGAAALQVLGAGAGDVLAELNWPEPHARIRIPAADKAATLRMPRCGIEPAQYSRSFTGCYVPGSSRRQCLLSLETERGDGPRPRRGPSPLEPVVRFARRLDIDDEHYLVEFERTPG